MIYSLPGDPLVKYSMANIMRFDSVDSYSEEVIEQGLVEFTDQYQESVEIMRQKNVRINLSFNGQTKVLCIENIDTFSLEDILSMAGKKFRGKFKKLMHVNGGEVKQEDIKSIKQGDVLVLSNK